MPTSRKRSAEIAAAGKLITELGGGTRLARLLGVERSAVYNWRQRGFPRHTYIALQRILTDRGLSADPSLWRMTQGNQAAE